MQKQDYKDLGFSIRKCGKDEIEIRLSTFDGYIRGFVRTILVGMLCVGMYFDTSHGIKPFSQEIASIKQNITWAFNPNALIEKEYNRISIIHNSREFMNMFPEKKIEPYNEFSASFNERILESRFKIGFCLFGFFIIIFLFFFPKMNGIRVNRKKRLIYWQSIAKTFEIAYVPEKGNPLAGLVYDKFGLYAFGGGKRFSLRFDILTQGEKEPAHHYAGVYPTPSEQHNDHILLAVQAYLTEENPEFLQYIGKRFKVFGSYPAITFCNFAALPCCFSHKKAQIVLDKALEKWRQKTENQKQGWFNTMHGYQKRVNRQLEDQELDNQIKKPE
ncbi:hypothetical protein BKG95_01880 [Rodentibacter pneumotropicus]|uniref:Transmembrane protein n=1 Tax=Rodentibacter pneumotropicus TaxID=758 RepID=A0AAW5LAP3_9PAST|nr:hypothetical protein [Rodentibacter pneumotropicus]MCQ9120862.1 hypothetical protein [Rodentibacter pneumotropicus]OOF69036.1 hypothetical protein BKG95_01880 [Rodentibacter pneumotropicus]